MKEHIQNFWQDPVNRFWLFGALASLFILSYGAVRLYRQDLNDTAALLLISVALISELIFLVAMIINGFSDTKKDYLELFQKINRNIRYRHYLNKNKDKEYKGPSWKDTAFQKITDTKQRVDAYIKASIEFQQADFENWKKRNIGVNLDHPSQTMRRNMIMFAAGFLSMVFLVILIYWLGLSTESKGIEGFHLTNLKNLIENSRGTVLIGIITTFIVSPVIYVVWVFRDANNRVQIENSRKDTNLKDFQKLSEWASGFHLPEVKQTTSIKTTNKTKGETLEESVEEKLTTKEDSITPDESISISRRQGAEALQASAIAQLEAFMFGKYGEQFMQPAFLLLHAIWESIITRQLSKQDNPRDFLHFLYELHKSPIVSALNKSLVSNNGMHLRLFEKNLAGLNLMGLNSKTNYFNKLNFAGYNIRGSIFSYCNLEGASLVGVKFLFSKFNFADLSSANFSGADLYFSELYGVNLSSTILVGTNLASANLTSARLNNTDLTGANLSNASLRGAKFTDVSFKQTIINQFTAFGLYPNKTIEEDEIREDILSRGAIWDDDPEWLVGKIENPALLDKIRQDYAEREKQKGA